jgi:hypothetical protein
MFRTRSPAKKRAARRARAPVTDLAAKALTAWIKEMMAIIRAHFVTQGVE